MRIATDLGRDGDRGRYGLQADAMCGGRSVREANAMNS